MFKKNEIDHESLVDSDVLLNSFFILEVNSCFLVAGNLPVLTCKTPGLELQKLSVFTSLSTSLLCER